MDRAEQLKREAQEQIAAHRGELEELSLRIHGNPELSLEEEKSSQWLAEYLSGKGFEVTKPAYGLPTAFEAVYGEGSPSIGIIAEYDALPGIGHACGHNVIATAAMGAGLAAKAAADAFGATIRVIGTPGEEGRGGKIRMARNGAFRNVDAAMMVHPGDYNTSGCEAMAVAILSVEFHGKASHAAGGAAAGRERAGSDDYFVQRHQLAAPARGRRQPRPRHHHRRGTGGERGAGAQRGAFLHPGQG